MARQIAARYHKKRAGKRGTGRETRWYVVAAGRDVAGSDVGVAVGTDGGGLRRTFARSARIV